MKQNIIQISSEQSTPIANKVHNIVEHAVLVADMTDDELNDFYTFTEVVFLRNLLITSLKELPETGETVDLLTHFARHIKAHIKSLNEHCDESSDVDA